MAVTVIDSQGELAEYIAEQEGEPTKTATEEKPAEASKSAEKSADKDSEEDADDVEGEDGLTPREKAELSEKMLKAVGKRVRRQREAEEFATATYKAQQLAEMRADELERELSALKESQKPPQEQPKETAQPERSKFATEEEYIAAVVDWRVQTELRKMQQEETRRAADRKAQEMADAANKRISKAIELVDDFQSVIKEADEIMPPLIGGYMSKSEMVAELGYYFAKHPGELTKLGKLDADEQLVQVGIIKSTLTPFGSKGSKDSSKDGATPSSSKEASQDGKQSSPSDETGSPPSKARVTAPVITPLNSSLGSAVEKTPREQNIRETITSWQKANKANLGLRKRH